MDYSSPSFYRFTQDSLLLSREVIKRFGDRETKDLEVLDLCSGCGVIGLEILQYLNVNMSFCEIQEDFAPFFYENVHSFTNNFKGSFKDLFLCDYRDLNKKTNRTQFDLIVSNPPYYKEGTGKSPKDLRRKICRFMSEERLISFEKDLGTLLKEGGEFFYLNCERKILFGKKE